MNNIAKFFRDTAAARFFIPAGLVLSIFGIVAMIITIKNSNFIDTEGVVSKVELYEEEHYEGDDLVETTYTVMVKYTVDEKEYEAEYGVFPEQYKVGDKVTVSYDPDDPSRISAKGGMILFIVFIVLGVGFLGYGIYDLVKTIKKNKQLKLQEEGWKDGN